MNVSDLMEAMSKAGAPMEAIILAVRALEAKDAVIDARRAGDRDRKRRQRAGTVTGQSRDTDGTVTETPTSSPSSSPDPSNNPTSAPVDHTPRARRAGVWPVPEGVEPQHWLDFLANRKRKRLANSQTAFDGVMRDIAEKSDAQWPPGALVEHAAAKGWGSINYPSDPPRNGHRNDPVQRHRGTDPQSRDGFLNALNEMSGYSAADYRH